MSSEPAMNSHESSSIETAAGVVAGLFLIGFAVVLVAFSFAASPTDNDTRSATAGLPDLQQELAAHEWLLDPADSSPATRAAKPVTLVFGEDVVSGSGPCNTYRGRLSLDDDGDTLTISDLTQTNRACDPETTRAELEYFEALQQVRDVDLDDAYNARTLVLDNESGDRLAYDAIDARNLLVSTWQVINVARDDAVASVVEGTNPILVFHADGDVTIDTGCNTIRSTFEIEGSDLVVGKSAQTQKLCEPAAVMEQEKALARALESADRVQVVPGSLTILDPDGRIQIEAVDNESKGTQ